MRECFVPSNAQEGELWKVHSAPGRFRSCHAPLGERSRDSYRYLQTSRTRFRRNGAAPPLRASRQFLRSNAFTKAEAACLLKDRFEALCRERSRHRNHHSVSVTRGNVLKLTAYNQGRQTACAFQDLPIQWIVVQRVRRNVSLALVHCQIVVAELLHIAELVGEQ